MAELIGLVVEAKGPEARIGERCEIAVGGRRREDLTLAAEVVGFREGRTLLMPLGDPAGIGPGQRVRATGGALRVEVGPWLLGRISTASAAPSTAAPPRRSRRAGRWTLRRPTRSPAPPIRTASRSGCARSTR